MKPLTEEIGLVRNGNEMLGMLVAGFLLNLRSRLIDHGLTRTIQKRTLICIHTYHKLGILCCKFKKY
jgi:hypothetical protein